MLLIVHINNFYLRVSYTHIWEDHAELTGEMRNGYKIVIGKPEGNRPLGRPSLNGTIILKWILGKYG
jgi:hypothetical protein